MSDPKHLVIEPGHPEDAADAAPLIAETDTHLFTLLGGGDLNAWIELTRWEWCAARGIYHHSMSDVARLDGQLVGLLVSYTAQRYAAIDWAMNGARARMSPERFRAIDAIRPLASFLFPMLPEDAYYVQNLAVAVRARKLGLGRRLMEHAFDRGRALGCRSCHLDVDASTRAVEFYRHLGMRVLVKTEVPELPAARAHFRMVIDL